MKVFFKGLFYTLSVLAFWFIWCRLINDNTWFNRISNKVKSEYPYSSIGMSLI